jgi:hypothetical protein
MVEITTKPSGKIVVRDGIYNGATAFFRNKPLLDTLTPLLTGNPRVLFHAVSIGAEAYSFAIHCKRHGINATIHATDINERFLGYAKTHVPAEPMLPVTFLPPMSFEDTPEDEYDFVFVNNAFTYVSPEVQSRAIANISTYNTGYLITTAFHQDTIRGDLISYMPILDNIEQIHNAWSDRLSKSHPEGHSWKLPPFSKVRDYEYKYCSIFKRI